VDLSKRIYVLDASALFYFPSLLDAELWTTELVVNEVKNDVEKDIVKKMIDNKDLLVGSAPLESIKEVITVANELSEIHKLSKADLSLLALSLYLKEKGENVMLLTDDYAMQNIALHLKINVSSISGKSITHKIVWEFYCPACRKTISSFKVKECPICGTPLKRKPKTKEPL